MNEPIEKPSIHLARGLSSLFRHVAHGIAQKNSGRLVSWFGPDFGPRIGEGVANASSEIIDAAIQRNPSIPKEPLSATEFAEHIGLLRKQPKRRAKRTA